MRLLHTRSIFFPVCALQHIVLDFKLHVCIRLSRIALGSASRVKAAGWPSSAGDNNRRGSPSGKPSSMATSNGGGTQPPRQPAKRRQHLPRMYLYIQMQLCQRESLRDWLDCHVANRNRAQLLSIFVQIVQAVDYVHSHGLMHRDLKVGLCAAALVVHLVVWHCAFYDLMLCVDV